MRYFLMGLCLLLPLLSFAQEEIDYQVYSYAEFFQMIEDEEDTIFRLENALIKYDSLTDERFLLSVNTEGNLPENLSESANVPKTDSLIIKIPLLLNNVQFLAFSGLQTTIGEYFNIAALYLISFQEQVTFIDTSIIPIWNCYFAKNVNFKNTNKFGQIVSHLDRITRAKLDEVTAGGMPLQITWTEDGIQAYLSTFNKNLEIHLDGAGKEKANQMVTLDGITIRDRFIVILENIGLFDLRKSTHTNKEAKMSLITLNSIASSSITDNTFGGPINLGIFTNNEKSTIQILGNSFKKAVSIISGQTTRDLFQTDFIFNSNWEIEWDQWSNNLISNYGKRLYNDALGLAYLNENPSLDRYDLFEQTYMDKIEASLDVDTYKKEIVNKFPKAYQAEREMRITALKLYREKMDQVNANLVYVELKDLETLHLGALYNKDPNFENFFTWKINQFLQVFSAYGTRPAKAIVFSLYVILAFALIYLFFPNHWDSHGKNRIVDRFSFFLKYMKRDAGMHDVYLEEKQGDILAYDEYKNLLESSGKDVPKFFQATGLPLYKWAISGTKLTASFLSRVDVMKGTWSELPQSKRVWKSVLLISAFLIALTYDIFIKMLNALMLSINTFTTLGFGEIPIKGLPRYLAIIQGFIGWFMLTIFSVSLISQLLN